MDYERGLTQLEQLLRDTPWEPNFQILETRLRENLSDEALYGTNDQYKSTRAQIIGQLNRLAANVGTSFNALCRPQNNLKLQTHQKNHTSAISANTRPQPQPASIKPNPQRTKAYISFSERDKPYLNELRTTLNQFKGLNYWDRDTMLPGATKRDEITAALNSTRVAILLISSDYLAAATDSDNPIANYELPSLLAAANNQEAILLNVIVRPCAFELSDLEPYHSFNTKPLSSMNRNEREEIWNQVARQVLNLLR
jgi:hypothetical protein